MLYLALFLSGVFLELILKRLNVGHLKQYGSKVPGLFEGFIDRKTLARTRDYTIENQNFDIIVSAISNALFVVIVLSGLLPWISGIIQGLGFGILISGLIFFTVIGIAEGLSSLPFAYYRTFIIEGRYGFNTSTLRIWITDILKSAVIGSLIGGILLLSVLALIEYSGCFWWLWAWSLFFAFQSLLVIIYPTFIAPWFNKFIPLEDRALEKRVKEIMHESGLSVTGIFTMDAGKRSWHTNAYFTGLGKAKRIILFDTLMASHSHDEIIAILAHEVGHCKKRHIHKNLLIIGGFSLFIFYLASSLLRWDVLYQSFGFQSIAPYVGLFLTGMLWDAIARFLAPIGAAISRRFEREADVYAARLLQQTEDLRSALKRLAKDNLSNLYPHPLYAWFYYSHPPLSERIQYLEAMRPKR